MLDVLYFIGCSYRVFLCFVLVLRVFRLPICFFCVVSSCSSSIWFDRHLPCRGGWISSVFVLPFESGHFVVFIPSSIPIHNSYIPNMVDTDFWESNHIPTLIAMHLDTIKASTSPLITSTTPTLIGIDFSNNNKGNLVAESTKTAILSKSNSFPNLFVGHNNLLNKNSAHSLSIPSIFTVNHLNIPSASITPNSEAQQPILSINWAQTTPISPSLAQIDQSLSFDKPQPTITPPLAQLNNPLDDNVTASASKDGNFPPLIPDQPDTNTSVKPKSFAQAVHGGVQGNSRRPQLLKKFISEAELQTQFGSRCDKDGDPVIRISRPEVDHMVSPFQFTLVGKFSKEIPHAQVVNKFLLGLKLIGGFKLHKLNYRHILIKLEHEADFTMLWTKSLWQIDSHLMRVFKWTPNFDVRVESSVVPVWVNIPAPPAHFVCREMLISIGQAIGRPIQFDYLTATQEKFTEVRMCVEIDLLKPRVQRVFVEDDTKTHELKVNYEYVPYYCTDCYHVGHTADKCYMNGNAPKPEFRRRSAPTPKEPIASTQTQMWVRKEGKKVVPENRETSGTGEEELQAPMVIELALVSIESGRKQQVPTVADKNSFSVLSEEDIEEQDQSRPIIPEQQAFHSISRHLEVTDIIPYVPPAPIPIYCVLNSQCEFSDTPIEDEDLADQLDAISEFREETARQRTSIAVSGRPITRSLIRTFK